MEHCKNYTDTKKRFFDNLPESAFAVSNADDAQGAYMLRDTNAKKIFL
jgi:UDP-N-acetylmuramoyl-L-alanyl-D-glutamate--2,6-diaminopimelate ligase